MAKVVKKQVYKIQDSLASPEKDIISEEKDNIENNSCNNNNLKDYKNSNSDYNHLSIRFTNQNLMEALLYSEILGKPKCKRRGRCR
jgi:ribonuclease HIII